MSAESAESERVQSRKCRECEGTDSRGASTVHDESTVRGTESECKLESKGSRVQRVESTKSRVQSRECRVESAESARAQSLEGAQCTMRAQFENAESECRLESTESARMKNVLECKTRECRVEGTESARMQSRECNLRVQRRECRDCENPKSRVQRL